MFTVENRKVVWKGLLKNHSILSYHLKFTLVSINVHDKLKMPQRRKIIGRCSNLNIPFVELLFTLSHFILFAFTNTYMDGVLLSVG